MIKFQKEKAGSPIKDLTTDFNLVSLAFPFQLGFEAKDGVVDDWADEDGEDVYVPDVLKLKAYNLEAEFGYKGTLDSAQGAIDAFLDYLIGADGNGVMLKIYDLFGKIGRKGVKFQKYDPEVSHKSNEDLYTFKVTFRVTDPKTKITL